MGCSVHLKFVLKKNNKIGKTIATVKIYLDQVICNIGIVILKYLAKPSIIGSIIHADKFRIIAFINYEKYFKEINTIMGTVTNDIKVDTTIILDILSTISFGEYIDAIKYVNIALGIEDCINKTPAA